MLGGCGSQPQIDSESPYERQRALSNPQVDAAIVANLARHDAASFVRIAALKRVDDQLLLAEIAGQDAHGGVRREAINRLTDHAVLTALYLRPRHPGTESYAVDRLVVLVKNISVQGELALIATSHPSASVRSTATSQLNDIALLVKIARDDVNAGVKYTAAQRKAALERQAKGQ